MSERNVPNEEEIVATEDVVCDDVTDEEESARGSESVRYKIGVVDNSEKIEDLAVFKAEQEITERRNRQGEGFFKSMVKKAYLRYFEEAERNMLIHRYRKELKQDIAEGRLKEEELATIDRFVHEDADKLMHTGEERAGADEMEAEQVKDLIKQYAKGEISEEELETFRKQFVDRISDENRDVFIRNEYKTDNISEIAKQIKLDYEHGMALERLDQEFDLVVGRARGGLRTKRQYSGFDKFMSKMKANPVLNVLTSPAVMSIAIGFGYCALRTGSRTGANIGSKVLAVGTFGAAAAIGFGYSAFEKNRELKDRMFQHSREMAVGGEVEETKKGNSTREKLEGFRLETVSASETTAKINEILEHGEYTPEELNELLDLITETKTRTEISDTEGVDLIGFSDVMKVEQERRDLDVAIARAEVAFKNNYSEEAFNGLTQEQLMEGGLLALSMNRGIEMDDKGDKFKRYKLKESLKAGVKGAVFALIGTLVSSEAFGGLHQLMHPDNGISTLQLTPIQRVMAMLKGEKPEMHGMLHDIKIGDGKLSLPKGVELIHHKDGSYSLLNEVDGKDIARHLYFNNDGSLTAESAGILKSHGIDISDAKSTITETITENRTVTDQDIIQGKGGETGKHFERIYRDMWYDNDTPMYRGADGKLHGADLNELRLEWGGVDGTGIDKDGNFVYDISHMMRDGSFHGHEQADFLRELQAGRLKMDMSLSEETQRFVASIKFNEQGQAIIPKDSPLAKIFFEIRNGHAVFKGRFAEVAQVIGQRDGHDVVRMLATDEGKGIHSVGSDFIKHVSHEVHNLEFGIPRDVETDFIPFIPDFGRSPLEELKQQEYVPEIPYLYYGINNEQVESWREERSPRLRVNQGARLSQKQEIDWYLGQESTSAGSGYMSEVDDYASELAPLLSLNENSKIMVCMAVAGEHEMANIYNTLELYSKQTKNSKEKTSILLNVNWKEGADQQKVNKTISEIVRAQRDFPELKIAFFTKELSKELIEERKDKGIEGLQGLNIKYLNDVALKVIQESGVDQDIYLLSNDADARGMSARYLEGFLKQIEANPDKDAFLGRIEWGSETFDQYPGYFVSMRVYELLEAMLRHGVDEDRAKGRFKSKTAHVASSGANFMVRASTYAAVGGYNSNIGAGSDVELGHKIRDARGVTRGRGVETDKYPIGYVNGAWIDTDPNRGLENYIEGKPIVAMWNTFDLGGYKPRGNVLVETADGESIDDDFENIISRIEFQITATLKAYGYLSNQIAYESALNYAFPAQNSRELWHLSNENVFSLSSEGRNWLRLQLEKYSRESKKETKYRGGRGVKPKQVNFGADTIIETDNDEGETSSYDSEEQATATYDAPSIEANAGSSSNVAPSGEVNENASTSTTAGTPEGNTVIPKIEEILKEVEITIGKPITVKRQKGFIIGVMPSRGLIRFSTKNDGTGEAKDIPIRFILNEKTAYKKNKKVQAYLEATKPSRRERRQ